MRMDFEDTSSVWNTPMHDTNNEFMLMLISAALISTLALIALILNSITFAFFSLKISRSMMSFKEKTEFAEHLLSHRRFAEELIGKLSNVANFDAAENEKETSTILNTMTT
uniref:CNNM transmembrane domain-containing protein n=1 Tax=Ascaris lumbricoides TaxID=6252 RepID=A0A0M3HP37_ASCLU